jgi:hypothetical protein
MQNALREYLLEVPNNLHLFMFLKKAPELKNRKAYLAQQIWNICSLDF